MLLFPFSRQEDWSTERGGWFLRTTQDHTARKWQSQDRTPDRSFLPPLMRGPDAVLAFWSPPSREERQEIVTELEHTTQ